MIEHCYKVVKKKDPASHRVSFKSEYPLGWKGLFFLLFPRYRVGLRVPQRLLSELLYCSRGVKPDEFSNRFQISLIVVCSSLRIFF